MKNIYLCINRGRRVRDLLRLGMLDTLLSLPDIRVVLLSPAYRVPEFLSEFESDTLVHRPLYPLHPSLSMMGVDELARRYANSKFQTSIWRFIQDWLLKINSGYSELFLDFPPDLIITANLLYYDDASIIYKARKCGIKTLGLMRSWDNILKRLILRTDFLSVWNPVNKKEAVDVEHYKPENVYITGAPDFDLYFSPDTLKSREDFFKSLGLDPCKKLLVYATVGTAGEETYLLDVLLEGIAQRRFVEDVQIVCRLHPSSRLEYFWKYREHPKLRFSFINKYIPTLGWTMTREDVSHVANLLHHADVLVSPGSTLTIEAAIFDTPTVVPVFNAFEPEATQKYYDKVFARHFKRIAERGLVPVIYDVDSLIQYINRYLQDHTLDARQRQQLVQDYVYYTDGKSGERVANLILQLIKY